LYKKKKTMEQSSGIFEPTNHTVKQSIMVRNNLLIEQSGRNRRMEIGASVGVYRIHGCALKDGT